MKGDGHIAVVGGGSWGTALATNAARAGHEVMLWARDAETVRAINETNTNPRYLPDIRLAPSLRASGDLDEAVSQAAFLLLVTPAQTVRAMAGELADRIAPETAIVVCAKGIERQTGKLPAQIVADVLPGHPVGVLSGPSFAADVARGLPTAVTVAAETLDLANRLAAALSTPTLRCYASDDLAGVELGGALKNVLALAVGAANGMALGASAQAALVARGFAEMTRLAVALGGRPQTLTGLSGLGDLVLTCSGPQSRNFAYGVALGRGDERSGMALAEGVFTAGVAARLARQHGVEAPIIEALSDVLDGQITAREAVTRLMERPLKSEHHPH